MDITDNAEFVGKCGKFISITEVDVDVLLFGVWAGSCLLRFKFISHSVGIDIKVVP